MPSMHSVNGWAQADSEKPSRDRVINRFMTVIGCYQRRQNNTQLTEFLCLNLQNMLIKIRPMALNRLYMVG